ncbi:NUMOD4 domain-containing protein [Lactococcus garvieae]|uniref:NUMOD4 domain-containing protein n=1 Tax=Lactococcus garvieae TaxID=1363 RepID=UPI001F611418|nr:NUMOD4 domain-containing protein [Lactococcus garvieae]MCI3860090.1 NUMOD4 domain-containing protein [Lactococcus garvieae]
MEIWKEVKNFHNYQVSNYGKVRSLNYNHTGETRELSQIKKSGYLYVNLFNDKGYKSYAVHRLVARAFVPNIYGKREVNHIDENPLNNNANNLNWMSPKENCNHGTRNARIGSIISRAQSKPIVAIKIDNSSRIYFKNSVEAEKQGFCRSSIRACISGKQKLHKGYTWERL